MYKLVLLNDLNVSENFAMAVLIEALAFRIHLSNHDTQIKIGWITLLAYNFLAQTCWSKKIISADEI